MIVIVTHQLCFQFIRCFTPTHCINGIFGKKRSKRKQRIVKFFFRYIDCLFCCFCRRANDDSTLIIGSKLDKQLAYRFVSDSNTFLAFAIGFCSFMYFKDLKIKQSRVINTVGGSTFGVLCIYANSDTMRKWLWGTVLNVKGAYSFTLGKLVLFSFISVLGVFVICSITEIIRQKLIEKKILNRIEKTTVYNRINERVELI